MLLMKQMMNTVVDNIIDLFRQSKNISVDIAKIESAVGYVQGVKKARLVGIGIAGLLLALVFVGTGFILLHMAFLYYVPWNPKTKATAVAILGAFYFLAPIGIVMYFLSEKKWLELTKTHDVIDKVVS
jgi:hypothetical protein